MASPLSRPARILVLEDEPIWQEIIQAIAADYSMKEVVVTDSIAGFKAKFKSDYYRAVLLDNQVRDGQAIKDHKLHEFVRLKDQDVHIVIISGAGIMTASNWHLSPATRAKVLGKDSLEIRGFLYGITSFADHIHNKQPR